jgi:colanic acid/amylovoran biosynthesis protein
VPPFSQAILKKRKLITAGQPLSRDELSDRAHADAVASIPASRKRRLQILVEPSDYVLRNVGDMAMLQTAMARLTELWPGARIRVLTDDPEGLQRFCPDIEPLPTLGRSWWIEDGFLPDRLAGRLPAKFPDWVRTHAPEWVENLWRYKLRRSSGDLQALVQYARAVREADVLVVTGMGGITDAFPNYAKNLLETIGLAVRRRKVVALMGQGIGPLQMPALVSRARAVLPRVDLVALREKRFSSPFLLSLGVLPDRIMITGDDAIAMAYRHCTPTLGTALGVNLRASDYAAVDERLVSQLRGFIQQVTTSLGISLVPVPISNAPGEKDSDTIQQLAPNTKRLDIDASDPTAPALVMQQIQRCRVVITGSYHAAVFALAVGIPAVCIAKSPYYVHKFVGLADMFGPGCEVVLVDEGNLQAQLGSALRNCWTIADSLKPLLLERASQQISLGRNAYARLQEIVERRCAVAKRSDLCCSKRVASH